MITENDKSCAQRLVVKNQIDKLQLDFDKFKAEGRIVHHLCYGGEQWVMLGEKWKEKRSDHRQTLHVSSRPPQERTDYYYKRSRRIHSMCFGRKEKLWVFISEWKIKGTNQVYYDCQDEFPVHHLQQVISAAL